MSITWITRVKTYTMFALLRYKLVTEAELFCGTVMYLPKCLFYFHMNNIRLLRSWHVLVPDSRPESIIGYPVRTLISLRVYQMCQWTMR